MDAQAAFRALHWGRPGRGVRTVRAPSGHRGALVAMGRLVNLELRGVGLVEPRGATVWLATDPGLRALWLVAEGELVQQAPSGPIAAITYDTRKGELDAFFRHPFSAPLPELVDGQIRRGASAYFITEHGIGG